MSQQNVEAFKRALDAGNRRDLEALLEVLDPDVRWHPVAPHVGGEEAAYRGHEGIREMWADVHEAFADLHLEILETRDIDDRVVAICSVRTRGSESGLEIESPLGYLVQFENGKATEVRSYTDPEEALGAAGLRD